MPISEAKKKANKKYDQKTYYRPTIFLRREYEELLHKRADEKGLSVSGYIIELIKKDLGVE